ncbi:hypothetical protein B7463_g5133, partial [Scytalidium lignicola]
MSCRPQRPAQKQLMEALKASAATDLKRQYQQRDKAIDAIISYCTVEEGCTMPLKSSGLTQQPHVSSSLDLPLKSLLHTAIMSLFVKNQKERPRRYFICVRIVMSLPPDNLCIEELVHEFYTSGDLTKHFK